MGQKQPKRKTNKSDNPNNSAMPGSLQILVNSFIFSSFWLRDFFYFKFPFCLSCLVQ